MNVRTYMVSVIALILLVGVTSSAEAVSYSNNFDSLALGTDILTQAGWAGGHWGTASVREVSNEQSVSSSHSLKLNGPAVPGLGGDPMIMINLSDPGILGQPLSTGQWRITFDYWVTALGTPGMTWTELPQDSSLAGWNTLQVGAPFNLQVLEGIDAQQWNSIVMNLDFDLRTMDLSADGGTPDTKEMKPELDLGLFGFQPTTNQPGLVYIDNFSITMVVPAVPGDYNSDTIVDAADYTMWRDNPDGFGGDPGGYDTWVANFGMTAGSGGSGPTSHAVPEPSAWTAVVSALGGLAWGSIGRASRRRRCPGISVFSASQTV